MPNLPTNDPMVKSETVFDFEGVSFSVTRVGSEAWFPLPDLCRILGFKNAPQALATHVEVEDSDWAMVQTSGGAQRVRVINEAGFYSLVMGSKVDGAKRFKRWVATEVLPSIRKTGEYQTAARKLVVNKQQLDMFVAAVMAGAKVSKGDHLKLDALIKVVEDFQDQSGIKLSFTLPNLQDHKDMAYLEFCGRVQDAKDKAHTAFLRSPK